ncbi:MAG: hypothetical protein ACRDIY_14755 [Chloroflexota bacterium]
MGSTIIATLRARGVPFEASDSGEWARFRCPHGGVRYVVHSRLADGYQTWCDANAPATPEWFPTADAAVAEAARL